MILGTSWFRRCHATLNWTKIHKASEVEEHPMYEKTEHNEYARNSRKTDYDNHFP